MPNPNPNSIEGKERKKKKSTFIKYKWGFIARDPDPSMPCHFIMRTSTCTIDMGLVGGELI